MRIPDGYRIGPPGFQVDRPARDAASRLLPADHRPAVHNDLDQAVAVGRKRVGAACGSQHGALVADREVVLRDARGGVGRTGPVLLAEVEVDRWRHGGLGRPAEGAVDVVGDGEEPGPGESLAAQEGAGVRDRPGVPVGIDDAVERRRRLVLARVPALLVPREPAVVPADSEFPHDVADPALEVLDNAGHGLALPVHALRAEGGAAPVDDVVAVLVPRRKVRERATRELPAGRRDRDPGARLLYPGEGVPLQPDRRVGLLGLVVDLPEGDARIRPVRDDDVLDIGLQPRAVLLVAVQHLVAGADQPSAVVNAADGGRVTVVRAEGLPHIPRRAPLRAPSGPGSTPAPRRPWRRESAPPADRRGRATR